MEALSFTIETIEDPDRLAPVLEALGRRHVGYGARDEHYDIVISLRPLVLLRLLQRRLNRGPSGSESGAAGSIDRGFRSGGLQRGVIPLPGGQGSGSGKTAGAVRKSISWFNPPGISVKTAL
jgi:hypothetical protein